MSRILHEASHIDDVYQQMLRCWENYKTAIEERDPGEADRWFLHYLQLEGHLGGLKGIY